MLALLLAGASAAQTLDGRPLRTESARTLAFGEHAVEIGAEGRAGVTPLAILDPLASGDHARAPVLRWRIGFGRSELQLSGAPWQHFDSDAGGVRSSSAVSDLTFWLKVQATRGGGPRPALGFAVGTKMPNAGDETGLGTDESDVFAQVLLDRVWGSHEVRLNLGLAILGDPHRLRSQEDLLTYGVAGRHGKEHALIWELWGRALSDSSRNIDESALRLGWARRHGRFEADASLLIGLERNSGDLGVTAGVTAVLGHARPSQGR